MVYATPEGSARRQAACRLLVSMSDIVAIWARQASKVTRKLKAKTSYSATVMGRPKQLMKSISNTAMTLVHKKKNGDGAKQEEEYGDGGVWQRTILMGDKCQPLDFPGVIYYDSNGKQMNELPLRSPRASPLPAYLSAKTSMK